MKYIVVLDVEAKENGSGTLPDSFTLNQRLTDVLADQTKHDETIGWRVTQVSRLQRVFSGQVIW